MSNESLLYLYIANNSRKNLKFGTNFLTNLVSYCILLISTGEIRCEHEGVGMLMRRQPGFRLLIPMIHAIINYEL